jgi:acylphosphatase
MMSLPADNIVPISPASANNVSGRIMNIQDGHIHIDHNGQTVNAQKAFSCLVEPQLNDIVLYTQDQHQQAYVIAILQRDDESSMNL